MTVPTPGLRMFWQGRCLLVGSTAKNDTSIRRHPEATAVSIQPVFLRGVFGPAFQMRWPWPLILCQGVGNYLQTTRRLAAERGQSAPHHPGRAFTPRAPVAEHLGSFQVQTQIAIIKQVTFQPKTMFLLCCVGNNRTWFGQGTEW